MDVGLKDMGDSLGTFTALDESYKLSNARSVAHILVDLDVRQGLFESINIVMGDMSYVQILDYVNIPFRCSWCRRVGHILVDCD